jgi:hypothetical protein
VLSDAARLSELASSSAPDKISPKKKRDEVAKRWFIVG